METNSPKKRKKKLTLPILITIGIVIAIVVILFSNKKKIDEASVQIDRTKIPVSVTTSKVEIKDFSLDVNYPAVTKPLEDAKLFSQTNGLITLLNVELGQYVKKGQTLGKLDTQILQNNLKAAQISYKSAQINLQKLLEDYQRAQDLYENKAGLETSMLSAKNNYENAMNSLDNAKVQIQLIKNQIADATIIAPISGIISSKSAKQGEYISPSTPIATISDISMVKVTAYVDQELTYQLKVDQWATISTSIFKEATFRGKIIFISPVADANHNYQVDLLVSNQNETKLKGGTDVQVSFHTISERKAMLIPKSAINTDEQNPYVYVVKNGKAKKKEIVCGLVKNDFVEILSGLQTGERVITRGQINLTDGSLINYNN